MLSGKIKELMKLRGWNQVETAKKSGLTPSQISAILSNRVNSDNITTKNADKLATAFGITIDELLGRKAKKKSELNLDHIDPSIRGIVEDLMSCTDEEFIEIINNIAKELKIIDKSIIEELIRTAKK